MRRSGPGSPSGPDLMPTYEYECVTCGTVFDRFQAITARPLRSARCDACGKTRRVRRRISGGAGLLFKGSGFYITDYRSKPGSDSGKSEDASAQSGETKATKPGGDGSPAGGGKSDQGSGSGPTPSAERPPRRKPPSKDR
jgi:putative FmdB family regulatory protein